MKKRIGVFGLLVALVATSALMAGTLPSAATGSGSAAAGTARTAATTIRIWADRDRKPAVTRVANQWASRRGVTVEVVEKEFGKIRDDLKTVRAENAPDVIVGAHDWTGQLAADGLVLPLFPKKASTAQVPGYALDAFSNGTTTKRLYGAPVAIENAGLVVNTRLARVPKNWADLEKQALAFKNKGDGRLAIAVQQGQDGDAYHMYPFFSGLCGYVFGKNKSGALNPKNIGLGSSKFLKNTALVDKWNRTGLINAKVNGDAARDAFLNGKAAFWVTGPWNIDTIVAKGIKFQVVQVPKIKCKSVPFLGAQGFMVTRFATTHGVTSAAKDLVSNYMLGSGPQVQLSVANGRYPANTKAGKAVKNKYLAQFGRAGQGGVPMPNIPQMGSVWSELGGAWVKATRGEGATKARAAFATAARNILNKIG